MDAAEFEAWFRLLATPGVNRGLARRLVAACGTPEAVLVTPLGTLRSLAGEAVAHALHSPADETEARLAAARTWLAGRRPRSACC